MAERGDKEAFVTLATNDTYALGCLVLGNSLRQRAKTTCKLVVMVTQGVSQSMRNQLSRVFDMIYDVNLLDSRDSANLQLLGRPDLSVTFTKLHCWRLTMFEKAVFLDADTLILQNVDELFDREELSAAPDAGWPDCFNSGVFVFRPSEETYNSLIKFAMSQGSFDGGDQGLLNMYFRDWATKDIARHLPFIYNVVSQAFYSYLPAFTQFKDSVKIVHFIGATKPWHHPYNTATKEVTPLPETGHNKDYLQIWWDIFMTFVQPTLDPSLTCTLMSSHVEANPVHGLEPPKATVPIIYPYKPPDIEDVSYHSKDSSPPPDNPSEVKEVPVITRIYSSLESHYAEEPISVYNQENKTTSKVLEVPQVVNTWAAVNEIKREINNPTVISKPGCVHEQGIENSDLNVDEVKPVIASEEPNSLEKESDKDSGYSNTAESTETGEGGLIGELASLSIDSGRTCGGSQAHLTEQERKLNWERGQVDYLGADKFDNIEKKLNQSMEGPADNSKAFTSPFSNITVTSKAVKPKE
ncbi:glycogenin-1-like [Saccostrea cucullata]|uniref:glycogenin-1-like n=1 Tax=Saccostrea cuccullata TaxID=36930 RepID=UPI002ED3A773